MTVGCYPVFTIREHLTPVRVTKGGHMTVGCYPVFTIMGHAGHVTRVRGGCTTWWSYFMIWGERMLM